jgi:nitroreductase
VKQSWRAGTHAAVGRSPGIGRAQIDSSAIRGKSGEQPSTVSALIPTSLVFRLSSLICDDHMDYWCKFPSLSKKTTLFNKKGDSAMEYFDLIQKRHSVRSYRNDPIEKEKLLQVLDAARLAPTAHNKQAFKVVVLRTAGREEELKKIYHRDFFTQAPVVLGIFTNDDTSWTRTDGTNYGWVDATIVADHLILAATALGLGTCWIGDFNPQAARDVVGLGRGFEPVAFIPLGYPGSADVNAKKRKPLDELVVYK